MSLTSGFFDSVVTGGTPDRLYTAEDMNNILDGVVSDGICEWGNNFDFDLDSSNPNKPYIKSGRGKIAKHWFTNDGTALAALTNSTNNTKYYAICISCDLSSRTVSFVYKPSSTGSTSIPDIHANDTDTLKTCGLWMITLPPHTSLSDAESSWSSLIGTAPSGDPHPENYTPYIQFLGDAPEPDLSNYVQKTGSNISGGILFIGPDAKIMFNGVQSSANGISGHINPLGEGKLTVTGVKSPTEPTDAVPKKYSDQFITYSASSETICGYYGTDRPIYRKTYEVTIPGASGTRSFNLDNLSSAVVPINMYGTIKESSWTASGTSFYPVPLKQTLTSSGGTLNREVVPNANASGKFDLNVTWSTSAALVARIIFEYLKPV